LITSFKGSSQERYRGIQLEEMPDADIAVAGQRASAGWCTVSRLCVRRCHVATSVHWRQSRNRRDSGLRHHLVDSFHYVYVSTR